MSVSKKCEVMESTYYHPAKYPRTRPYVLPPVMQAQWYTPADEGIAEAISAMHAAIMK